MNRRLRLIFALWLVAAGTGGSPQPCVAEDDATPVTLRNATEVHRLTVRLSDVFDGVPADIDHDIAQSPYPGKQATYDVNVLTRLAQKYHLDWKSKSLADHVVISTACARITADMIREAVTAKFKEQGLTKPQNPVDVAFDSHAVEMVFPDDHVPGFTLNNFEYDASGRRFRADVVADSANGVFSLPVTGRVTVKRNVPVLTRRLEGGTIIGAADIDFMAVPEDRANGTVLTDTSQLIGRELRRDIDGGELIHTQDIIPPRFVTRGSLVTLKIQTEFMTITAQGKALQDGAKGDAIRVINTQSNRTVEGTVDGPGTVRVDVTQKVAVAQ